MSHLLEGAACPRVQILCLLNCERRRCFAATTNSRPPPMQGILRAKHRTSPGNDLRSGVPRTRSIRTAPGNRTIFDSPLTAPKCPGFPSRKAWVRGYRRNPVPRSLYLPIDRTEAAPSAYTREPEGSRGPFAGLVKLPDRGRSFRSRQRA